MGRPSWEEFMKLTANPMVDGLVVKNRELNRRCQSLDRRYFDLTKKFNKLVSDHANLKVTMDELNLKYNAAESHSRGLELLLKVRKGEL